MNRRYIAWVGQDTATGSYTRSERLYVNNFRTSEKGLGSASLILVQPNPKSNIEGGYYTGEINPGKWIKITDTTLESDPNNPTDGPQSIVWMGYIESVVEDIPKDAFQGQGTGVVTCQEIGWYLSSRLLDNPVNEDDKVLYVWPVYNPLFEESFYANKFYDEDNPDIIKYSRSFETSTKAIASWQGDPVNQIWPGQPDTVWSKLDVIKHLFGRCGISIDLTVLNLEKQTDLTQKIMRSYPSFQGENVMSSLDQVIESPLTWSIDYKNDTLSTIKIVLSSEIEEDIAGVGAGTIKNPLIEKSNINVTRYQPSADRVIYRGNRILVGGTFTTNNTNSGKEATLDRSWTNQDKDDYRKGIVEEVGEDLNAFERQQNWRKQNLPNVYRKFVWKRPSTISPEVRKNFMFLSELPGDRDTSNDVPYRNFFPVFTFTGSGGDVLSTPLFDYTLAANSEPNLFMHKFEENLPLYEKFTYRTWDGVSRVKDNIKKFPIFAAYYTANESYGTWMPLIDSQNINGFEAQVEIGPTGITLDMPYPEMMASDRPEIWEDFAGSFYTNSGEGWLETDVTPFNPSDPNAKNFGNWRRMVFSISARSDQFAEYTETKQRLLGFDPNGVPTYSDVNVQRTAIIDDPDLELWFIHKNTAIGVDFDFNGITDGGTKILGQLTRAKVDQFTRNDYPEIVKRGKEVSKFLFKDRRSLQIRLPLSEYNTIRSDWAQVGNIIGQVRWFDPVANVFTNYIINTSIKSIEVDGSQEDPSIIITTEIPDLPVNKKIIDAARTE